MYNGKLLKFDISELPLPVGIKGRNGKHRFYRINPSAKTQGAWMCAIEEPFHQQLLDKFNLK